MVMKGVWGKVGACGGGGRSSGEAVCQSLVVNSKGALFHCQPGVKEVFYTGISL